MDFQYSSEHTALRDSTRDFLDVHGSDERGWNRLCTELELPGLAVPVEYGGVGATLVESAIVFEEFGRALSPLPLASHVFAVHAVLCLGDDEQRHRLPPGLLGGTLRAAFAVTGRTPVTRRLRRSRPPEVPATLCWTGYAVPCCTVTAPICSSSRPVPVTTWGSMWSTPPPRRRRDTAALLRRLTAGCAGDAGAGRRRTS